VGFNWVVEYGSIELKSFQRIEGNTLWWYNYSIKRDRDGNEVSRTEPERGCGIEYSMPQKQSWFARLKTVLALLHHSTQGG
jgi:hypothetical protein